MEIEMPFHNFDHNYNPHLKDLISFNPPSHVKHDIHLDATSHLLTPLKAGGKKIEQTEHQLSHKQPPFPFHWIQTPLPFIAKSNLQEGLRSCTLY